MIYLITALNFSYNRVERIMYILYLKKALVTYTTMSPSSGNDGVELV